MSKFKPVTFEVLQFEDHLGNRYDHNEWSQYVHDRLIDEVDLSAYDLPRC